MTLVRRGWDNPAGAPRSSLQRVEYRLAGASLERVAFPHVDGASPLPAVAVANGVRRLQLRYRSRQGEWHDAWEPARQAELPVAVELLIDLDGRGGLRQLFLAGSGDGR